MARRAIIIAFGEIAAGRSPSFRGFLDAVMNGDTLVRR